MASPRRYDDALLIAALLLLLLSPASAAAACSATFANCLGSKCCSSANAICLKKPGKTYAQCRPLQQGQLLLPSGILSGCVDTKDWECPRAAGTAAASPVLPPTEYTANNGGSMAQLCDTLRSGVETVARSSVEALRQPGTITNIVRQIGLYSPVDRKGRESFKQLYGSEYRSATIKRGLVNNGGYAASPSELHGLWQIPQQLECALIYLSKFKIASHLTVGTYSGWTDVVIHSVLRRFNPRLRSVITDQGRFFHPCVGELIDSLRNVRFQQYASGNGSNHIATTEGSVHGDFSQFGPRSYDFCFIDAAHSFLDTQADLQKAWSMCRIVMLHDIVQSSGVRPLWHATVSSLTEQRGSSSVRECLYQPHPNASLWSDWKRDRECTNALLKRSGPPPDAIAAHGAAWLHQSCPRPASFHIMGIGILRLDGRGDQLKQASSVY